MRELTFKDAPDRVRNLIRDVESRFHEDGSLEPTIRAWRGDDVNGTNIPVGIAMQPGRKWVIEQLLIQTVRSGATAVALTSEAWCVFTNDTSDRPGSPLDMAHRQQLERHADREEVLNLFFETATMCCLGFAKINRLLHARPRLGRWKIMLFTQDEMQNEMDQVGVNERPRFQDIFRKAAEKTSC